MQMKSIIGGGWFHQFRLVANVNESNAKNARGWLLREIAGVEFPHHVFRLESERW